MNRLPRAETRFHLPELPSPARRETRNARGVQGWGGRRLGGLERRGELIGARLDGLGYGHDESSVAVKDVTRVDNRKSDDPVAAGSEAKDVPLGCFFALAGLRWTDVRQRKIPAILTIWTRARHRQLR